MTNFALIHGAGSAGFYWARVVPYLQAAGHAVVAPDLPIADPEADFEVYADAVDEALDSLPLPPGELVVVGQSMGAFTAPIVVMRRRATRFGARGADDSVGGRESRPVLPERWPGAGPTGCD